MNPVDVSISVDLVLIGRCLTALLWGIGWACFIQLHRLGRYWADERTWITVVIGVGVDWLIGIGADWPTFGLILVFSGAPVIYRSLVNESQRKPPSGYRVLWALEDSLVLIQEVLEALQEIAENTQQGQQVARVSRVTTLAHTIHVILSGARRGEYSQSKRNGKGSA